MKRALFGTLLVAVVAFTTQTTSAQDGEWGNLTGQIVVSGDVPANLPEAVGDNKDKAVCLVDGKVPLDDGIVVNDKKQLRDVYVMMYIARGDDGPEKYHPSYEDMKALKITIDNKKCRFVPKALFARSGQTLELKNSDNVGHNCRIATIQQEHNVNIVKNASAELKLDELSDKVPGEVKCDMHTWMDGVILIRDNPYVAISDKDGKFTIKNIPAGNWNFQFWHKKAGYLKTIEITGYTPDKRRGYIGTTIENGKTLDLGTLTLPGDALSR
ncbi:MAG: plastocyanin [Mariniblastus sp.]|jgi:plastocyanin